MGTFGNRDCVDKGSNPVNFTSLVDIFLIASGMSERSFCIIRRIPVRLPLASQIAYECFSFTDEPQTDLKHLDLESSLGNAWSIDADRPRRVPRTWVTWVLETKFCYAQFQHPQSLFLLPQDLCSLSQCLEARIWKFSDTNPYLIKLWVHNVLTLFSHS